MRRSAIVRSVIASVAIASVAVEAPRASAADAPSANEIMRRHQQAFYYGGNDLRAKVEMRLIDKAGRERRRTLTMLRLNAGKKGDQKYYVYFHNPADVRGTAFLVWKYADRDDDRWIFIPAIGLTQRIAAKDAQSSFVGSDFTYEDVSGRDIGGDTFKLVREEKVDGRSCWVVETLTAGSRSYARRVSWIDQETFLPVKEEFYDVQNDLVRLFHADEIKTVDGYPSVTKRTMRSVKTGHTTEVTYQELGYDVGLLEGVFSRSGLDKPPKEWVR